jgi:hypothetical protein
MPSVHLVCFRLNLVWFPVLTWKKDLMWEIMNVCVTMHNIIIESEREHPIFNTDI